jgi:hypothetical protein
MTPTMWIRVQQNLYFGYAMKRVFPEFLSSSYVTSKKEFCVTFYLKKKPNLKFHVLFGIYTSYMHM